MFSWLAATGVQHGRLHLDLQQRPPSDLEYLALDPGISLDTLTGNEVLSMVRFLTFRASSLGQQKYAQPLQQVLEAVYGLSQLVCAQAMTQFHILLLTARSLQVVSRISGQTVQDIPLSSSIPNLPPGCFLSLVNDAEAASLFLMAGVLPMWDSPCMPSHDLRQEVGIISHMLLRGHVRPFNDQA